MDHEYKPMRVVLGSPVVMTFEDLPIKSMCQFYELEIT